MNTPSHPNIEALGHSPDAWTLPAHVVMLNACFVGTDGMGADEQLANLHHELEGLGIGLTVI
jgi:hypothetical protein